MRNVIRINNRMQGATNPAVGAIPAGDERAGLIALIQRLIPLDLHAVGDVLEAEVSDLAEERCRPLR